MIKIADISKWYGPTQVLKNCTTEVARGEVVVVCGPSGSGKSTLIKCVNGLEPFQKGHISVDGISVGDAKTDLPKLRARTGMVFQHFELFPHLSVMRNLVLPQIKVLDVMVALAKDGMTMIVVTHEMGFARKVAHRVVFMDKGEIVEDAPTAEFFGKPRSERAQLFLSKILQH